MYSCFSSNTLNIVSDVYSGKLEGLVDGRLLGNVEGIWLGEIVGVSEGDRDNFRNILSGI